MSSPANQINPMDHLGLVGMIASRWIEHQNRHCPIEQTDEFQNGCIGLVIASRKFDGSRGITFATYAIRWIKQCISRNKNMKRRSRQSGSKYPISEHPLTTFSSLENRDRHDIRGWRFLDKADDCDHVKDSDNLDFYEWLQENLTDRERVVVYRHIERNETFSQIAESLIDTKVSKSLVAFIYTGAIKKMRDRAEGYGFTASNF